jgi:predicted branched-subunit amino acid permease
METFWQDLRYGIRMLLKAPSVSIVATIALALGIGANTAIFSVVNAVLLRPLPFANSEQLMTSGKPTRLAATHAELLRTRTLLIGESKTTCSNACPPITTTISS